MFSDSEDEIEYASHLPGELPRIDSYTLYQQQLLMCAQQQSPDHETLLANQSSDSDPNSSDSDSTTTSETSLQITQHFRCPISMRKFKDPVIASDGITYERSRIQEWLGMSLKSPSTNVPLASTVLTPNLNLRQVMQHVKVYSDAKRKRKREMEEIHHFGSEEGVFVYKVVASDDDALVLRHAPSTDFGLTVDPSTCADAFSLKRGQVVSANMKVTLPGGIVFLKLEHSIYWIPETCKTGSGILEPISLVHPITPWIFKSLSKKRTKLRKWPDYSKEAILSGGGSVECSGFIKTGVLLKGEHGDLFARVQIQDDNARVSTGWLFVSRRGDRILQQVTDKGPPVPNRPGSYVTVTVALTIAADTPEPTAIYFASLNTQETGYKPTTHSSTLASSTLSHYSPTLSKRLRKLVSKSHQIHSLILSSDNAWCLSAGGTGIPPRFYTSKNLELPMVNLPPASLIAFSNKTRESCRPHILITPTGEFNTSQIRSSLTTILKNHSKSVQFITVTDNGEFFVRLEDGRCFWEFDDYELCKVLERGAIDGSICSGNLMLITHVRIRRHLLFTRHMTGLLFQYLLTLALDIGL
ncbi:UNVERIFIED_CONTAM: WD repeat, SAM and U-box domain-containing protein 1 [Siphonaria sp. JEL0065]|nr:WD repeat, SAM and U-box domain-containing protein 1 [Siphonaria sp. JEL0065]